MNEEIKVHVVKSKERRIYRMRYLDPYTGKHVSRSAETDVRRDAEKAAAVWEDELRRGEYRPTSKASWADLVEQYSIRELPNVAQSSATTYFATFNKFEKIASPQHARDLTTERIARFAVDCRKAGLREATIARHLRVLKVLSRWAVKNEFLARVPEFNMPKHARGTKRMRGRPITVREFNEMLRVVPVVLADKAPIKGDVDAWRFFLKGLWASGLRLSEALALRWQDAPGAIVVDFRSGKFPVLRIAGDAQKSGRDQVVPIVPEFARLLESIPADERTGRVFKIGADRFDVGKAVSAIGEKAGIVVDEASGKFASCHDLRRAFGYRYSRKVMPPVLRELMRHATVETTMQFYVGNDAQRTAGELWAMEPEAPNRPGARLGTHDESAEEEGEAESDANPLFPSSSK